MPRHLAAPLKELQQGKVGFGVNNLILRISKKRLTAILHPNFRVTSPRGVRRKHTRLDSLACV